MNVHEYEAIMADPARVKTGVLGMFYAQSRRPVYGTKWGKRVQLGEMEGSVNWDELPTDAVERMTRLFDRALRTAVDDYTTDGCACKYCVHCRAHGHKGAPLIMCMTRWDALPPTVRMEIGESLDD